MKNCFILFPALFGLLLLPQPAWAETNNPDLKQIESEMASGAAEAAALKKRENAAAADLEKLRQQLVTATQALQDKESETETLSDKLEKLSETGATKEKSLQNARGQLASLTSALLQLSREPPEALLLHPGRSDDQIHRSLLLRSLVPKIQEITLQLARDINDVDDLKNKATEQRQLVSASRKNLEQQKNRLDQLIKTRQGLLQKTAAERAALAAQLAALTSEAKDLRDLMQNVGRQETSLALRNRMGRAPSLRQGLRLPVAGRVLHPYGEKDSYGVRQEGLTLIGKGGSPIVAPAAGRVVFAGPFKGYGLIVILAHGDGYHSFLSGFGVISIDMGQDVAAGEPLGALPDSTVKADLYFEWRKHGEAVNPEK